MNKFIYKLCFLFAVTALFPNVLWSQFEEDRTGIKFRVGFGVGHSKHADSYEEYFAHTTKQYDGFQIIVVDARVGWRLSNNIEVFGNARLSPADSIISPYRSRYLGGAVAYYALVDPDLKLYAGYGYYTSNIKSKGPSGAGNLLNLGFSWEFGSNLLFDINVMTGSLSRTGFYSPNPFTSKESNVTVGFAFSIF